MAPRFSIIVPVYNREAEVDDLVESLLAQTCKNFELVIAKMVRQSPVRLL